MGWLWLQHPHSDMMVEVVLGAVEAIIFFVHCSKNSIFTMIEKYKSLAAKKKKKKNIRAVRLTELYGDQGRKYLKVPKLKYLVSTKIWDKVPKQ